MVSILIKCTSCFIEKRIDCHSEHVRLHSINISQVKVGYLHVFLFLSSWIIPLSSILEGE